MPPAPLKNPAAVSVKKALETMTSSHVDGQTHGIPVASNVDEDVTADVTRKAGNSP